MDAGQKLFDNCPQSSKKETAQTLKNPDKAVVYFWRETDPRTGYLSQWYRLPFYDPNDPQRTVYKTAEHYMMYHKAILFGDTRTASKILKAEDAKTVKALGRTVSPFNNKIWERERERIVTRGSYCKFTYPIVEGEDATAQQQPRPWKLGTKADALTHTAVSFREVLLQTGNKKLVEASPSDKIWGIGFRAENAGVHKDEWGLNLLGMCLMRVRQDFRAEEEAGDQPQ